MFAVLYSFGFDYLSLTILSMSFTILYYYFLAKREIVNTSIWQWIITIFIALLVLAFLFIAFYKYVTKRNESMEGMHKAVIPDQYKYSKTTHVYNGNSQPYVYITIIIINSINSFYT